MAAWKCVKAAEGSQRADTAASEGAAWGMKDKCSRLNDGKRRRTLQRKEGSCDDDGESLRGADK